MNYRFGDLTAADVILIGEALDLLPHGRVQKLVAKIQSQLGAQEGVERQRIEAEHKAAVEAWRDAELTKLRADLQTRKPRARKRRR